MDKKRKKAGGDVAVSKTDNTMPSPEEQLTRRQSAPRPTPQSEILNMLKRGTGPAVMYGKQPESGAMSGFRALQQVIGSK